MTIPTPLTAFLARRVRVATGRFPPIPVIQIDSDRARQKAH
jgi:hypothetical protein